MTDTDGHKIIYAYAAITIDNGTVTPTTIGTNWRLEGIVTDNVDEVSISIDDVIRVMTKALKKFARENEVGA